MHEIISNYLIIISRKHSFYLSLRAATRNSEEKKCYETFHTVKLSLGALHLVKNVNRSDLIISKLTSPVMVCS